MSKYLYCVFDFSSGWANKKSVEFEDIKEAEKERQELCSMMSKFPHMYPRYNPQNVQVIQIVR